MGKLCSVKSCPSGRKLKSKGIDTSQPRSFFRPTNFKRMAMINQRTFKNFGHKRQPIPLVTTLWHGFLTFTFIGLGIEWKRIKSLLFGGENEDGFMDTSTGDNQSSSA